MHNGCLLLEFNVTAFVLDF